MSIYLLGTMYEEGKVIEVDKDKALLFYRKAAELGNESAQERIDRTGNQR